MISVEMARHRVAQLARDVRSLPLDRPVPQNAPKRLRERQILIQSDIGVYRFEDETFKDETFKDRVTML
jgi:hypothetical protein